MRGRPPYRPRASDATRWPSTDSTTGRWPMTSTSTGLLGVEHERPVEEHVRRHRREQQGPVARRHDRPPGRQRVGGRTGGGRDDQAVGRVRGERRAVDLHQQPHGVAGLLLLEHAFVQRPPASARRRRRRARRTTTSTIIRRSICQSPASASGPATNRSSAAVMRLRLDLGEVAEQADVHADDRDRRAVEQLDGAQHRAVAAEAERELGACRRIVFGGEVGAGRARRRPRASSTARARAGAATMPQRAPAPRPRFARGGPRAAPGSCVDLSRVGADASCRVGCVACTRNSRLPSPPVIGESHQPSTSHPAVAQRVARPRRGPGRGSPGSVITPCPLRHLGPAGLELRLHQQHEVATGRDDTERATRDDR